MKHLVLIFSVFLLCISCNIETETSQDPSEASKEFIAKYIKGDYAAIYEDGSIEMKAYISKEVFLNTAKLQEKICGKIKESKLEKKSTENYQTKIVHTYDYLLSNEKGEKYNLTASFLNGHLLKNLIKEPKWKDESDIAKELVSPIIDLIKEKNYDKIYELLGKKYPLDQIKSLIQQISKECDGTANRYESSWMDNDKSGKMMVAFVYAYEGKGYLDYRFYIEKNKYPFAGIFFTPDSAVKLP